MSRMARTSIEIECDDLVEQRLRQDAWLRGLSVPHHLLCCAGYCQIALQTSLRVIDLPIDGPYNRIEIRGHTAIVWQGEDHEHAIWDPKESFARWAINDSDKTYTFILWEDGQFDCSILDDGSEPIAEWTEWSPTKR
jgi:hypothetical protein